MVMLQGLWAFVIFVGGPGGGFWFDCIGAAGENREKEASERKGEEKNSGHVFMELYIRCPDKNNKWTYALKEWLEMAF